NVALAFEVSDPRACSMARNSSLCAAMELLRSEEMNLVQLIIPVESAHATISYLGELGLVQFKDLNADKSPFQRTYANQVKRCVEMARKLRFFRDQMSKTGLSPSTRPALRPDIELDDLELKLGELETELLEINSNSDKLRRGHSELQEFKLVLQKVWSAMARVLTIQAGRESLLARISASGIGIPGSSDKKDKRFTWADVVKSVSPVESGSQTRLESGATNLKTNIPFHRDVNVHPPNKRTRDDPSDRILQSQVKKGTNGGDNPSSPANPGDGEVALSLLSFVKGCRLAVDGGNLDVSHLDELNKKITKVEKEQVNIRAKQCDIMTNFKVTLDFLSLVTQHLEDGKGKDKSKAGENIKIIRNGLENVKKAGAFFSSALSDAAAHQREIEDSSYVAEESMDSPLLLEQERLTETSKQGRLGFISGLIPKAKAIPFERILFRATRGNMYLKQVPVEEPVTDPVSGEK
ncbi:hypothetical protein KI387_016859, partial [Taxus chinensis]